MSRVPGARRRVGRLALLVVVIVSPALVPRLAARAQSADPEPAPVSWRANVEWISALRGIDPADTTLNPGNATFRLPQLLAVSEIRPNIRVGVGDRWQVVARPRWRGTWEFVWADPAPRTERAAGAFDMTEAYVHWQASDVIGLAYGLQNFQWGPAELVSPSNRIFHEVGFFRDPLYYVYGRHLVRLNLSSGKQWSLVALGEVGANDEPAFRAGERFEPAAQAKVEFTTPDGASYYGATAGGRRGETPWFGEYASVALTEGLSAYVDAVHQSGSQAWYPVATGPSRATMTQADRGSGRLRTFAIGGLRYTFTSGLDARVELVYQDAGYSESQSELAALAVASERSREVVDQWLKPGLEFLGRRLLLASVRVPDLGPADRVDLQARYLASLTDDSGVGFVTLNVEAGGAALLFASLTGTHGREVAEFSRLVRASVVGGLVWSW